MDGYARTNGDGRRSVVEISTSYEGGTEMDEQAAHVHHQHAEHRTSDTAASTSRC